MNTDITQRVELAINASGQFEVKATGLATPGAIQFCLAGIETLCKRTIANAQAEGGDQLSKSISEDLFEKINMGASSLLDRVFPEIALRPDLTEDAIAKAENDLFLEDGKKYVDAYAKTAQADKDVVEHNEVKANLALQNLNREQRRKLGVKKIK